MNANGQGRGERGNKGAPWTDSCPRTIFFDFGPPARVEADKGDKGRALTMDKGDDNDKAMPKVAKRERKADRVKAGSEVMLAKGYDPIVGIMSVIEEKKPWPEDEVVAKGLLSRDWEPAEEAGYLQPSVSVRLRAHTTLAEYGYSRRKAEEAGNVNVGVVVEIKQYEEGAGMGVGGEMRRFDGLDKGKGGLIDVEVRNG